MIVKINPDELQDEIKRELENWAGGTLRKALNEAVKETAETGAKMLREGGPYTKRTGAYSKGWVAKLRRGKYTSITGTEEYSVNNKTNYQLTHLLEKGHASRNGGRVRAYEHIKPVEEFMGTLLTSNINKKIRDIT